MNKRFNEVELSALVTGVNKTWLTKKINQQKKFGNYDCISCEVKYEVLNDGYFVSITFEIGEQWGIFTQAKYGDKKGTWVRDLGSLRDEQQVTKLVNELAYRLGL